MKKKEAQTGVKVGEMKQEYNGGKRWTWEEPYLLSSLMSSASRSIFPSDATSADFTSSSGAFLFPKNDRNMLYPIYMWQWQRQRGQETTLTRGVGPNVAIQAKIADARREHDNSHPVSRVYVQVDTTILGEFLLKVSGNSHLK